MAKQKCVVMFSGGLDSRLVIKLMKNKGFDVFVLYFRLPFSKDNLSEVKDFLDSEKVRYEVFDCKKGKLLREYLKTIKLARFGRGAGVNPCIDCKIFMLNKARIFADKKKINYIVTGEVVGQRPMSQQKKQLELIEKEAGLKQRIIRPLTDLDIVGRKRDKQINLAKKFRIDYPDPAGGCLLCEKQLKNRFNFLLNRGISDKELKLVNVGRHFNINNCWVVIGRDESENKVIENINLGKLIIPNYSAPSAVIFGKCNNKVLSKVNDLIMAYSKKGSLNKRKGFDKWKL